MATSETSIVGIGAAYVSYDALRHIWSVLLLGVFSIWSPLLIFCIFAVFSLFYCILFQGALIGQAVYVYGNMDLQNSTVTNSHDTSTSDVYLEGFNISIASLNMHVRSMLGTVQSNMEYYGLTVAAPHLSIAGTLQFTCPMHFLTHHQSVSTEACSLLSVKCLSCPPNQYTILTPVLHISNLSSPTTVQPLQCLPCPPGAICDGDVRAIDNYWGTKVSRSELKFWPCPGGYCCSSQSTPCQTWDTCRHRRTGVNHYCFNCFHSLFLSIAIFCIFCIL